MLVAYRLHTCPLTSQPPPISPSLSLGAGLFVRMSIHVLGGGLIRGGWGEPGWTKLAGICCGRVGWIIHNMVLPLNILQFSACALSLFMWVFFRGETLWLLRCKHENIEKSLIIKAIWCNRLSPSETTWDMMGLNYKSQTYSIDVIYHVMWYM